MNKKGQAEVLIVAITIVLVLMFLSVNMGNITGSILSPPSLNRNSIEIQNGCESLDLRVKVGTIVKWTNRDQIPHVIQLDERGEVVLRESQSFEAQFSELGPHRFVCDTKKGIIFVNA